MAFIYNRYWFLSYNETIYVSTFELKENQFRIDWLFDIFH